nr:MAG TPA: hypothetical protein [Caudoviricetes sp.]
MNTEKSTAEKSVAKFLRAKSSVFVTKFTKSKFL